MTIKAAAFALALSAASIGSGAQAAQWSGWYPVNSEAELKSTLNKLFGSRKAWPTEIQCGVNGGKQLWPGCQSRARRSGNTDLSRLAVRQGKQWLLPTAGPSCGFR